MSNKLKLALIYFLQFIPLILYPPSTFQGGWYLILFVVAGMLALGYFLLRGRSWALKMSIFLQGFNIIIRLMMGFSHAINAETGLVDGAFILVTVLGIIISGWVLIRLDQPDVHATIVA